MTIVKRICFEPSDIRAIQLECKKCGTTVSCKVEEWRPEASRCPNCSVTLIGDGKEVFPLKKLAESLHFLLTYGDEYAFRLRLEFNQED